MSVTAVLIDDEPLLLAHLGRMLSEHWEQLSIVGTASDGEAGLAIIDEKKPDLVFLDIKMPRMNGLDVARLLCECDDAPIVVFVTAYDEFAVDAFEHQAVDYLLKPIEELRLTKTIKQLKKKLNANSGNIDQTRSLSAETISALSNQITKNKKPQHSNWQNLSYLNDIYLVNVDDIIYAVAEDKYTTIVTTVRNYTSRKTISQLSEQLDSNRFMQLSRSTIININCIDRIRRDTKNALYVCVKESPTELKVSRSFAATLKNL